MNKTHYKFSVFIPAYNESESVKGVIYGLRNYYPDLKIFVIDDGSLDGTGKVSEHAGANVLRHPVNLGGGAAIRTAFILALLQGDDYIITMDGDGQHDPKDLKNLLKVAIGSDVDLVIGSRFLGKTVLKMELYRSWGIRFFSWLVSQKINIRITDATSCYRVYSADAVKDMLVDIGENQYYALETIISVSKNGRRIVEVPISNKDRIYGKSKKGFFKYFYNLMRVIFKNIL